MRIASNGQVRIGDGVASDYSISNDANALLQLTSATTPKLVLIRNDTSIVDGNHLGLIDFHSRDGGPVRCARIGAVASGDHATDDNPTDLIFRTCPDGSASDVERLRIGSNGNIGVNCTPVTIHAAYQAIQLNNYGMWEADDGGASFYSNNAYINTSGNWVRMSNDHATDFGMDDGSFFFRQTGAGSGNITWHTPLTISNAGVLTIKAAGDAKYLVLNGSDGSEAASMGATNTHEGYIRCADNGTETVQLAAAMVSYITQGNTTTKDLLSLGASNTSGGASSGRLGVEFAGSNSNGLKLRNTDTSSAGQNMVVFIRASSQVGSIETNNSSTTFNTSSDYRLKENQVAISDGITRLKTLKPYRFNWKVDPDKTVDGFFAHEVTAVPEAVKGTKDAVATEDSVSLNIKQGDPIYQEIDQSKLVPLLTAALQEEIAKREALEARIAALESA